MEPIASKRRVTARSGCARIVIAPSSTFLSTSRTGSRSTRWLLPDPRCRTRICAAPSITRRFMLTHPTIEKLHALHLTAMATAFDQQRSASQYAELGFDDRFGLLVETEWTAREQRRLTQRLRHAKLRYPASHRRPTSARTPLGSPPNTAGWGCEEALTPTPPRRA